MSKREKKSHFGKRLWDSITEPLPDDNDDQNNEQIPLAYDLKDSASATDKPSESTESAAASAATKADDKPQQAKEATTSEAPKTRRHKAKSQAPAKKADPAQSAADAKTAQPVSKAKSNAAKQPSKDTANADQATTSAAPKRVEKPAVQSAASQKAGQSATSATAISAASATSQPTIAVHGTESDDEEQPELPLSREELYGDQQPNGGREPKKHGEDTMSRVARYAEHSEDDDLLNRDDEDNPHLKKKSTGGRPHQKPTKRYSWKLMGTGVAILIIAALGALLMWNRAKTTQADAKSNAESIVQAIYTSSAQRDLRANASTDQLKQLQTNIDNMKASDEKDALQKQHDYASRMMLVRTSYKDLRNASGLINVDVTTKSIASDQQKIASTGLTTSKTYFAKKYNKKFTATSKIVKKVAGYDADFKKLYTKKGKLKATTASSTVDEVQANLKAYQKKSQLAANDYRQLKADRKKLAKAAASSSSSASSYSESSSSYSEPESSSSSSVESSSDLSTTTDSSSTSNYYGNGNDTQTSSATSSSSTTHSSGHHTTTGNGSTGTDGTTTGQTTGETANGTTTNDTTTTGNN